MVIAIVIVFVFVDYCLLLKVVAIIISFLVHVISGGPLLVSLLLLFLVILQLVSTPISQEDWLLSMLQYLKPPLFHFQNTSMMAIVLVLIPVEINVQLCCHFFKPIIVLTLILNTIISIVIVIIITTIINFLSFLNFKT